MVIKETVYENREHFQIETRIATYFLDKAGGGLSRVIDTDGVDWVHYNGAAQVRAPEGAASRFRGIPNLVYGSDDGGAGHPGFDRCISEKINESTIHTRSRSGQWAWTWRFFEDHVRLTVEKTDPEHAYWFLYEGPVAGSFKPACKYWGTDEGGPRFETPSLNRKENIQGHWQWAYFGDRETSRVLFIAQQQKDDLIDYFSYMGSAKDGNSAPDGMVVFGFGRDVGAKPLMKASGVTFIIGFLERKIATEDDHTWVRGQIEDKLNQ